MTCNVNRETDFQLRFDNLCLRLNNHHHRSCLWALLFKDQFTCTNYSVRQHYRKMCSTISPKILGLRPLTVIPVGGATTLCHRGRRTLALNRKLYVGKRLTSSETGLNLTKLSGLASKPHQLLFDTKSLDGFLLSVTNCPQLWFSWLYWQHRGNVWEIDTALEVFFDCLNTIPNWINFSTHFMLTG